LPSMSGLACAWLPLSGSDSRDDFFFMTISVLPQNHRTPPEEWPW
jgi:hypothetical protein